MITPIPQEISKPKLLIGEGQEEVRFFNVLLAHLNIHDVQVEQYGGKRGLLSYLKTLVQPRPGFRGVVSLGVTQDADNNAVNTFQSVCGALNSVSLAVPSAPGGIAGVNPRVSVFILPDGQNLGMLEDLCLSAVQGDPGFQCVAEFFNCVHQTMNRQPNNMSKARMHAWLASQTQPDLRLGEAAEKGYWPWSSPAFDHIKQFLHAL